MKSCSFVLLGFARSGRGRDGGERADFYCKNSKSIGRGRDGGERQTFSQKWKKGQGVGVMAEQYPERRTYECLKFAI